MVFYVYLQPEVVGEAQAGGTFAMQSLIGILRGFLQNCCIAEFDDYRDSLKAAVNALPEDFNRTELKSVLAKLAKLHRFAYCLQETDYLAGKAEAELAVEQSDSCLLDLLLLEEAMKDCTPAGTAEVCMLANYQNSEFERRRSQIAGDGITHGPDEMAEADLLNGVFLKMLRHASGEIEICDCILGEKFGDNFEYTIKVFLSWLGSALSAPGECSLTVHCGTPGKATPDYIKTQLAAFRAGPIADMKIAIQYYVEEDGKSRMPHERFILTDQFAVHLERGMDFLDKSSGKNRDAFVTMKSHAETVQLLDAYKALRASREEL